MNTKSSALTLERLRSVLDYEASSGKFIWKVNMSRKISAGASAGHLTPRGYVLIVLDRASHRAHRLAWLHHHGTWPVGDIDHINGMKHDNRIANLRVASAEVNHQNLRAAGIRNRTGLLGVVPHRSKWQAHITVNGKTVSLGTFATPDEAHLAYVTAKRKSHEGCTI